MNPITEFKYQLKNGVELWVYVFGRYVPAEPGFRDEIVGFDIKCFDELGDELHYEDLVGEWSDIEMRALEEIFEAMEEVAA